MTDLSIHLDNPRVSEDLDGADGNELRILAVLRLSPSSDVLGITMTLQERVLSDDTCKITCIGAQQIDFQLSLSAPSNAIGSTTLSRTRPFVSASVSRRR